MTDPNSSIPAVPPGQPPTPETVNVTSQTPPSTVASVEATAGKAIDDASIKAHEVVAQGAAHVEELLTRFKHEGHIAVSYMQEKLSAWLAEANKLVGK